MYHYFYDSYVADKKYKGEMAKTETRLMDLGINGKVSRLSFLKNIEAVLKDEVNQGAKTLVVVGNDNTFGQLISHLAGLDVAIGFIPIGEPNQRIARLLGLPGGNAACDVLSARIIEELDLGKIGGHHFLTSVELAGEGAGLNCDGNYFLSFEGKGNFIKISNLAEREELPAPSNNGFFTIEIRHVEKKFLVGEKANFSFLTSSRIGITDEGKPVPITVNDSKQVIKTPAELQILPKKLKMIVGKNRLY